MQQTETYKLNKPETTDPLTPAPLNENADKLDAALADHEQRVVALEGCRVIVGVYRKYTGDEGQVIDLGGRPLAVLAAGHSANGTHRAFVVGDQVATEGGKVNLRIVDNGFQVFDRLSTWEETYCFLAIIGGWTFIDIPKVEGA